MALRYHLDNGRLTEVTATTDLLLAAGTTLHLDLAAGGCWYGHGFNHWQPYPLNAAPVDNPCFAVNNIQSPIWMASCGAVVHVPTTAALRVRANVGGDGWLRLSCAANLTVRFIVAADLPAAQRQLMTELGWPNRPPAPEVFGDSIFCTWTQYPRTITRDRILGMARQIRDNQWPCTLFAIDDRWESAFGELRFGPDFPDPAGMIDELHALDFQVLLWVTPFVNREAATFADLAAKRILVPRRDGAGPAMLRWWGGEAGLVDLSNPAARDWYRGRLEHLRHEIGVDGFKIDGGDGKYQPSRDVAAWYADPGPSGYADLLLGLAEEVAPGLCETRTAWASQGRHIIWREGGKDSHWGADNGLQAVVNLALHLGLMGYDILIPDMVPGRVQTMNAEDPLPTDEYFIRYTEAACFFPVVQFSYFPWNYARDTAAVAWAYARLHKDLQDYLVSQAADRTAPLLRPLWYDAPRVSELYTAPAQFQLGDDLVVAPVTAPNVVARDVWLPPGEWVDAWTGAALAPGFHAQVPAPCPGIPVYVRAANASLVATVRRALAQVPRGTIDPAAATATWQAGLDRDLTVTG